MGYSEAWTDEQLVQVRRIFRRNGTLDEAMAIVGTSMTKHGFRKRLLTLGLRFRDAPSIYLGTSSLMRQG